MMPTYGSQTVPSALVFPPPLACCRMSLERIVKTRNHPTILCDTIIAILEFNWYCSGG